MISDDYERLPLAQIIIPEDRQRRDLNLNDHFIADIGRRGILVPLILHRDGRLIAGERRLEAARSAGLPDVPVRYFDTLDPREAREVELVENLHRRNLAWREEVAAVAELHNGFTNREATWTMKQTADTLGYVTQSVQHILRVARDLDSPRIAQAQTYTQAYNVLLRQDERTQSAILEDIITAGDEIVTAVVRGTGATVAAGAATSTSTSTSTPTPITSPILPGFTTKPAPPPPPSDEGILCEDFCIWAASYSGPRFSFIHCDFPYGLDIFHREVTSVIASRPSQAGRMESQGGETKYDDDPNVYWTLIDSLCTHLDKLMAHEGHLMFWFSMEHYTATLARFRDLAPSLHFSAFPLFWGKSDNVGILPDPRRGPRQTYETALWARREDPAIAKPVANAYWAPTDKRLHPHTKPEPVLRHFFQMFVDSNTRMLDPTCGSGASIRAAEALGAKATLGIEMNPEYNQRARQATKSFRALRRASQG